ncbi:NAD(P)-dependent alcohol dehydrogenase [Arenibacter sp. BSSL-BM3]|uniref:NAD(P)-dependent alcohol dehydrogenase n=1 Tax=Arenibacter arenosicollis TaxID=2762274 RepID=A0ABR7QQ78_9FLAO|nr:NAD(P)-dependent alcohol dehydrogenase [Arenibacter arenosicollis]MBC8769351.1 NAD(P)-dependent alcohol dehydrogenase [Arenibacter arenosicollis]
MKAIVASGYGSPGVLHLQEVIKPIPKANEVLVRVMTASATTADAMMRTGKPYIARLFVGITKPKKAIPGTGFAGVVEQVGQGVTEFEIGDRVFGETTFGFSSNAEYLTISQNGVILPMPENLDFSEAANFCDGHLTSYNFLKEIAKVKPRQRVLINGASGALGTSAIQIARAMGAHVTAVCSGRNVGLVRSLGADEVIDYLQKDFTKSDRKYDYVYDTIGKSSFSACKNILSEKGLYLSPVLKFSLLLQMIKTSLFGQKKAKFEATGANKEEKLRYLLSEVLDIYKEGRLKTVIDRQFPLEKVAEAHRYIDAGHKRGNVVIVTS